MQPCAQLRLRLLRAQAHYSCIMMAQRPPPTYGLTISGHRCSCVRGCSCGCSERKHVRRGPRQLRRPPAYGLTISRRQRSSVCSCRCVDRAARESASRSARSRSAELLCRTKNCAPHAHKGFNRLAEDCCSRRLTAPAPDWAAPKLQLCRFDAPDLHGCDEKTHRQSSPWNGGCIAMAGSPPRGRRRPCQGRPQWQATRPHPVRPPPALRASTPAASAFMRATKLSPSHTHTQSECRHPARPPPAPRASTPAAQVGYTWSGC